MVFYRKRIHFVLFLFVLCVCQLSAQIPTSEMKEVEGIVFDVHTKQPLDNVILRIPELRMYQITDTHGSFQFELPAYTTTTIHVSLLGYQTKEVHLDSLRSNLSIGVSLSQLSLKLDEVTVTASRGQDLSTSSLINNEAIQYLQATDLSDLMQLLPGAVTKNPSLNDVSLLNIRGTNKNDATNALGTAVYVDGMQLSNNANMQRLSQQSGLYVGNANSGLDVRSISPENIESVEVIRGVPSVRYANMTSGAVLVKTKAGQMPYMVNVKVTPNVRTISAGKGWKLGSNAGYFNLSGDAGLSYIDMRTKDDAFKKLGLQVAYSNVFAKESTPFSLNMRVRYAHAKDKADKSTDKIKGEYNEATNQNWSGSVFGALILNNKFLTTLDYSASFQYESQLTSESVWHSSNQMTSSEALISGEHVGYFIPPQYMSLLTVSGKPFTSSLNISGDKLVCSTKFSNKITLGSEVVYEGNKGKGQEFDPLLPPSPNMRALSYDHLSNTIQLSGYVENENIIHLGKTTLFSQVGARISYLRTQDGKHSFKAVDPRVNLKYRIVENENTWLNTFSIKGAYGVLHKIPTMSYIYNDPRYFDMTSFSYSDEVTNNKLAIVTTDYIKNTSNDELLLPRNRKFEIGLDFNTKVGWGEITYFNEHLKNGFNYQSCLSILNYKRYSSITDKDAELVYNNGVLTNHGNEVSYAMDTTFNTYNRPDNGIEQKKWGIEYSFQTNKIESIYSSLAFDGAYISSVKNEFGLQARYYNQIINGHSYEYAGVYNVNTSGYNTSVYERLNTNFRLITHIPQLGIVTTLTLQAIWMEREYFKWNIHDSQKDFKFIQDGAVKEDVLIPPVYIVNTQGEAIPFTEQMMTESRYKQMLVTPSNRMYAINKYSPYFLLNLKVNKEIGEHILISFYANNFAKINPRRYQATTQSYVIKNPDIYFGAELKLKF